MRITDIFLISFFAVLFIFFSNNNIDITPEEVRNNLTSIDETLFNITENTIRYTNLYEEEPTVKNVVFNIAHGFVYGIVVDINTMLPIAVETAGGKYAATIMKFVLLYIVIMLIVSLPRIVTMVIALAFFISEKRKSKTKFYQ